VAVLVLPIAGALGSLLGCGGRATDAGPAGPDASVESGAYDASVSDDASFADDGALSYGIDGSPGVPNPDAGCPGMAAGTSDGAARVPLSHRASGTPCPMQRGAGDTDGLRSGDCDADTACTAGTNGRCLPSCGPPGCFASVCSYDGCFSDSDCSAKTPCGCRPSASSSNANACIGASRCAVDSDCGPGGYCSLSDFGWCGASYQCHTPCDACIDDADCSSGEPCAFHGTLGYWACGSTCGPAPP
jgi:hypothetical protein